MAIRKRTVSSAGDAISARGTMETRNNICECTDTVRAGLDIPWTAHFRHPARSITRRPNGKQGRVVQTLGVKTRLNKGTFVRERKGISRIPDVH